MVESELTKAIQEAAVADATCPLLPLAAASGLAQRFAVSVRNVEIAAIESQILPARYQRNLGTLGFDGQLRLLRSTCGIVGLGGLGGWVLEGLTRMGVGRLILIDGDCFADNNLNRQALCNEDTLGRSKVDVAVERVRQLNSAVETVPHPVMADRDAFAILLRGAEVVVDALDTIPARLALQDACRVLGVPMVHGAIAGYTGQVMTILPGDPGLHALFVPGRAPRQGVETIWGNPAATPMMVAAWQIQEVVKVITGRGELLRHRMLFMDSEYGSAEILRFE
jgi:molybdopterin-synthase adenylyltransferase